MNGSLYTASDSLTINSRRLQKVFDKGIIWAGQNGLESDMNKIDYMCFTRL